MLEKFKYKKLFRDYLYKYVQIEYILIFDIVKTREFQRLRRISQLGGTHVIFHTSTHNRFEHSLGTYELARKITCDSNDFIEYIDGDKRKELLFLVSALLHDIGHGPYSHTFETIFSVDHEKIGCSIITGESEINTLLKQRCGEEFINDVVSVISKDGKYPILESLISSHLDVDRLDYIRRDSYMLGVDYGSVDVDKIISSIRIISNKVHYKESAMLTIEDFLMGRYYMYSQVYHHPKSRAFDILIEKFISRILDLLDLGYELEADLSILKDFMKDTENVQTYLRLDDMYFQYLQNALQYSKDSILSDLCDRLLNRKLFEISENTDPKKIKALEILNEQGLDESYYFHVDKVGTKIYEKYVIISDKQSITLISKSGKTLNLNAQSPRIKLLTEMKDSFDEKIFYGVKCD